MINDELVTEKKKIGMPGELIGMKELADLFGWDESRIWWYLYSADDIMLLPPELRETIKAQIKVNPYMQRYKGIDFQYFKETVGMKVNDKDKNEIYYTRFCFEVWKRADGTYSLGNSKAIYIGQILNKNNYIGFYLKTDILELLNRWQIFNYFGKRCEIIPDRRKNCWLFLIEPNLLDDIIFSLSVHQGLIKEVA